MSVVVIAARMRKEQGGAAYTGGAQAAPRCRANLISEAPLSRICPSYEVPAALPRRRVARARPPGPGLSDRRSNENSRIVGVTVAPNPPLDTVSCAEAGQLRVEKEEGA